MANASTAGSNAVHHSAGAVEHLVASRVLAKLAGSDTISFGHGTDTVREAGSATLSGGSAGRGESVLSGSGAATLVGAEGAAPIVGGSSQIPLSGHGAFSFDTQVGGAQLIGNFISGAHSVTSGYNINVDQTQNAPAVGGQSRISLDDGKTVIHIKSHPHG